MSSSLVTTVYRSLLRNAKIMDNHREFKALLPSRLAWTKDKEYDFYGTNASCQQAIRDGFRSNQPIQSVDQRIDLAISVNRQVSQRVELLYDKSTPTPELLEFKYPLYTTTFDEYYAKLRSEIPKADLQALEDALELIQGASDILESNDMPKERSARVAKKYYEESVKQYPTADGYAFLGYMLYMEGELEPAAIQCEKAISLDPKFGNPYNDLGLIKTKQGYDDEAKKLFDMASVAPRYETRHLAYKNLAAHHLEHHRLRAALHSYIEALHWTNGDESNMLRNTIFDMGKIFIEMADQKA